MGKVEIKPATATDVTAVYGEPPLRTMRAYAAILDGKPIGVAGVYYFPDQVLAFSKVLPEYRHLKTAIGRGTLKVVQMLKGINKPVIAVADPEIPTAPALLERVGFKYVKTNSQGRVYIWAP